MSSALAHRPSSPLRQTFGFWLRKDNTNKLLFKLQKGASITKSCFESSEFDTEPFPQGSDDTSTVKQSLWVNYFIEQMLHFRALGFI